VRWLRAVIAVVLVLAVAYLGGSAWAWDDSSRVSGACLSAYAAQTPETFVARWNDDPAYEVDAASYHFAAQDVSIPSLSPGITLRAWWSPPADGGRVVIVIHGKDSCRRAPGPLLVAGMLVKHGFGVLVPDLRDHGESTREDGHWAGGTDEWQDVLGAWTWLRGQGYPAERIGLHGASMGAGAASIAMGREPAVAAAFLDSPYANILEATAFYAEHHGKPAWMVPGALFVGGILGGDDLLGESPATLFREHLAGRPVFIVHGTADQTIDVSQGIALAAAAADGGTPVTPWILDGVQHTQAVFVEPDAYEQHLVAFFDAALGR
jgi:alpha-beta hydrolase superfamily lysophospholipase